MRRSDQSRQFPFHPFAESTFFKCRLREELKLKTPFNVFFRTERYRKVYSKCLSFNIDFCLDRHRFSEKIPLEMLIRFVLTQWFFVNASRTRLNLQGWHWKLEFFCLPRAWPLLPLLAYLLENKDIDIFLILQDKTGDDEGDYPDYIFMYHTMKRTSINLSISVQNIDRKVWFKSGWVIN